MAGPEVEEKKSTKKPDPVREDEEPRRERIQPSTMMIPNHAKASELAGE